jgi:hypothetical protein
MQSDLIQCQAIRNLKVGLCFELCTGNHDICPLQKPEQSINGTDLKGCSKVWQVGCSSM